MGLRAQKLLKNGPSMDSDLVRKFLKLLTYDKRYTDETYHNFVPS